MDNINFSNETTVTINDRKVSVKKLGLIKYSQLTSIMKEVITSLVEVFQAQDNIIFQDITDTERNSRVVEIAINAVQENVEQVINFLNICIPELDKAYIEESVGLDDALLLINAILEVNNINKVMADGKKLLARLIQKNPASELN